MNTIARPTTTPPPSLTPTPSLIGDIESFLADVISQLEPVPTSRGPGRPPVMPALALWAGMLVGVLRGFTSQLAIWRLLTDQGLWWFPRICVSDEAVYQRLANAGTAPLQTLFHQVQAALAARLEPIELPALAPFAQGIYAVDQMTLDQVARLLPSLRGLPPGDAQLLPGKLAGIFDIRRQQWHTVEFIDAPQQNEKVRARPLVERLPQSSLMLADLGYFAFAWFDWLTDHGYWWVSRLREKTSYEVIHPFYRDGDTFDGIVWLGKYRADRAARAVRLVQFRVGKVLYQYLTNVLDPTQLSPLAIAQRYARRWDIELAFLLVKEHLNLHLLWSAKGDVIQQQLWAVLIISQVLQALRREIAWRAGVDPFEVSMKLLVEYAPRYAAEGRDPVAVFVERGRDLRFIRPSRRTVIRAPVIPPEALTPLPPNVLLVRKERHAQRKCAPRSKTKPN